MLAMWKTGGLMRRLCLQDNVSRADTDLDTAYISDKKQHNQTRDYNNYSPGCLHLVLLDKVQFFRAV